MKGYIIIVLVFFTAIAGAQIDLVKTKNTDYVRAYQELQGMLEGTIPVSFKRAVFITENAYLINKIDYNLFNEHISTLGRYCKSLSTNGQLIYNDADRAVVAKNAAVFKFMTDLNAYYADTTLSRVSFPYTYDFDDFWGEQDWSKMFVTKLLKTHSGNCHSLPFLYKILCEEIGTTAYLTLAPNHIYIKQFAKSCGWYNTELTSAQFPIDAWIMASGYIHLSAIQNGIYMDTLSQRQSIALCVVDLAKGYELKFKDDTDFVLQCADLALQYYPDYTNALLLKAETMKKQFERMQVKAGVKYPSEMFTNPEAKQLFDAMEKLYFHIYEIGYRTMPKEMYVNWLVDLKKHKEKYQNKEIMRKFNVR